jgi:hypothetical protein
MTRKMKITPRSMSRIIKEYSLGLIEKKLVRYSSLTNYESDEVVAETRRKIIFIDEIFFMEEI